MSSTSERSGKLFIVATPLGNLGDLTPRARQALETCDGVLAEDTRVTGRLLAALSIAKPLKRLDETVMASRCAAVIEQLLAGETWAFCSDAGMPALSDPGARLIAAAREAGIPVEITPGPSAADTAFVASGCPQTHFYFGAFLPKKESALRSTFEELRSLDAALVFFESPKRLLHTLEVIADVFPKRRMWICRELTKLHEEILEGRAEELLNLLQKRSAASEPIKGEITLVLDGPQEIELQQAHFHNESNAEWLASQLLDLAIPTKTVVSIIHGMGLLSRNGGYNLVQRLKAQSQDGSASNANGS